VGTLPKAVQLLEKGWTISPIMQEIYSYPYKKIVKREAQLAEIKHGERILSLGCGAIPFTAIFLREITGNPVTALDVDPVALEKAETLLKKRGLRNITLKLGNGASIDLSEYSVVVTALQVEPKKEILNNFFGTAPKGARLVMRAPRKIFYSSYEPVPVGYKPQGEVSQPMITFGKSLLYKGEKNNV